MLFLEHKKTLPAIKGEVDDGAYLTPIGVADVKREGDDLTCVSYGYSLHLCLDAAQRLEEDEGVSVEVVDVRTLAPLDVDTIVELRPQDRQGDGRLRGQPHLRRRRGDRLHDRRAGPVRPRRSDRPDRRAGHPRDAVRRAARALLHGARAGPHLRADARARPRISGTLATLGRDGRSPTTTRQKRRLHLPIVGRHERPGRGAVTGRKPPWLKVRLATGPNYEDLKGIMRERSLHTVCEEAMCPNIRECWEEREATFLILGSKCTRRCGFCDVMTAKPDPVDEEEPVRIAEAVREMGLRYVVLTGVARDDLEDGGARIWASAIRAVRDAVPGIGIEVLPSDFKGGERDIATVLDAEPDVFAHNLETVRRLHDRIRPAFGYDRSLEVLRFAKRHRAGQVTKSNLILGMGERSEEIPAAIADLRDAGIDILTMGQYLQPTAFHLPVDRWVAPGRVRGVEARRRGDGHRPRGGGTARPIQLPRGQATQARGGSRRRGARLTRGVRREPPGLPGGAIERLPSLHAADDVAERELADPGPLACRIELAPPGVETDPYERDDASHANTHPAPHQEPHRDRHHDCDQRDVERLTGPVLANA